MIFDHLAKASSYFALGEPIARALRYLQSPEVSSLAAGRHDIDGSRLFALVSEYETKPRESGFWEAHRMYLDVHCVLSGAERIGYAHLPTLSAGPYDAEADVLRADGDGQFFELAPGYFAVLAPDDAHMPGVALASPRQVRKVVMKVAVEPTRG